MADPADIGSELEEQHRNRAIEAARRMDLGLQKYDSHTLQVVCIDCDEPIPAARLRVHPRATRCIECQQIHEGAR